MRDIEDYTKKYVEEPFESTIVKIRKRMVIEQLEKYTHDRILEIGCGMDPLFWGYNDYKRMVIVEPGDVFYKNAVTLSKKQSKIKIIKGFLEDQVSTIHEMGEQFDFIILSSLLHELDDPRKMLLAIKSISNEKSIVHINVPNAKSLHRLIAKETGMIQSIYEPSEQMNKMQRRRTYDIHMLKDEVKNAGFRIIDEGSYFLKPFTHAQMQRCLEEGIINEIVIAGLENVISYMPEYGAGIYVNAIPCI